MVYLDEAGVDDTEDYPYGDGLESERFHALKLGHRTERIRMAAAWGDRQVLVPMTFQGHCNTALFEAWVEPFLVPDLAPGQVVVMDNASFHQSQRTQNWIQQAGCQG
ncbi:MAG: transposase, partial [Cyanobacteria bacterium P01_H01_bin.153]